ncbi:MAG TPA: hypothetical protein DCY20_04145 [Firmicutes bacterium]|nr:hypothetical protein [Bacillota bacterium]
MADYKKNVNRRYQSNYERYQQYRNPRRSNQQQSKKSQLAYQFIIQALIAGCVLMGVLVTQKLQDNTAWYEQIKTSLLSAFPYGKTNQVIENLLGGYPTLSDDDTSTVAGVGSDYKQVMMTLQELKDSVVIRNYLNGVIIEIEPGEPILSLVPGVVQFKNETEDTLNTIELSLADDSVLTIGFLENPQVSLYEHVEVNQPLGVGTPLDVDGVEMSYYYLALEVNGEVVDIIDFIDNLGSLDGLGQGSNEESDDTNVSDQLLTPYPQTDQDTNDSQASDTSGQTSETQTNDSQTNNSQTNDSQTSDSQTNDSQTNDSQTSETQSN